MIKTIANFVVGTATTILGVFLAYVLCLIVSFLIAGLIGVVNPHILITTLPLIPALGAMIWLTRLRRNLLNLSRIESACQTIASLVVLVPVIGVIALWFATDFH